MWITIMSNKEFSEWFVPLLQKHGGYIPPGGWIEDVGKSKGKIRTLLGGGHKKFPIDLIEQQKPSSEAVEIANRMVKELPDIGSTLAYNYMSTEDLFSTPYKAIDSHNAMRVSKWFRARVQRNLDYNFNSSTTTRLELFRKIDKYLAEIGQAWQKCRTQKCSLDVVIDTRPMAFAKLGHYGVCDDSSCFAQGFEGNNDKFALSVSTDTFVVSLWDREGSPQEPFARAWGFLSDTGDYTVVNYTNCYWKHREVQYGSIREALIVVAHKLLNVEDLDVLEDHIAESRISYVNEFGQLSIGQGIKSFDNEPRFEISDDEGLTEDYCLDSHSWLCILCGGYTYSDNIASYSGSCTCQDCYENSVECVVCDRFTLQENMQEYLHPDTGITMNLCPICLSGLGGCIVVPPDVTTPGFAQV